MKRRRYISVDQKLAVDAVEEVTIDKTLEDSVQCNPQLHTAYRSVLGRLNWLKKRTQVIFVTSFPAVPRKSTRLFVP